MKKLIVVSDWVDDSLTCQEFRSATEGFLKDNSNPNITFVSSTPSTIHTSFLAQQLVETEERYGHPLETVMFLNTDPRLQTNEAVEEAAGAQFIIAKLQTGLYVCGPNAGNTFTLLKPRIVAAFTYEGLDKGSQFRSRDLYSKMSAYLMDALEDDLELDEIHTNMIPELQGHLVGHIDNYGNIKTTMHHDELKGKHEIDEDVKITLNGVTKSAKYVSNLFGATPGELVIYPGSSGPKDDPYLEISIWRHFQEHTTAGAPEFNNPRPGMPVTIE